MLARIVTFDLHAGVGYGKTYYSYDDFPSGYTYPDSFEEAYKYSHFEVPETPLAFSAGFDIGLLIK